MLNLSPPPYDSGSAIHHRLSQVRLGEPQGHHHLFMYPLLGSSSQALEYKLLDEALTNGWARITELTESGSVPELLFENRSNYSILLVDGEELVGAKQNRILNLSVLVPARESVVIPVSCVEAGRWHRESREFSSASRAHYAAGRARKARSVSDSLCRAGSRHSDQSEVWDDISEKMRRMGAHSRSSASASMYKKYRRNLDDSIEAFFVAEDQAGAVFTINGRIVGMDLFDSAAAFEGFLPKLIQSYALDALDASPTSSKTPPARDIQVFTEEVSTVEIKRFPALGRGEDFRLRGRKISGGALVVDKEAVHLCAFRLHESSGNRTRDLDLPRRSYG